MKKKMAGYLYNGNKINKICQLDALNYGNSKEPISEPVWVEGTCDICRFNYSVASPSHWDGLDTSRPEITIELPPAPNP